MQTKSLGTQKYFSMDFLFLNSNSDIGVEITKLIKSIKVCVF